MPGDQRRHRWDDSASAARVKLTVFFILLLAGVVLGWNAGRLPHGPGTASKAANQQLAGDLAFYGDVITEVRDGHDYYDACRHLLPRYGFPVSSPLNWRLPTYAWLFAVFRSNMGMQVVLIFLALCALTLAGIAQYRWSVSPLGTLALVGLQFGVVSWSIDGQAYLAQEPWAATLLLVSISAFSLGGRWRSLAVTAGLLALFFRELTLPYCGVALLVSLWRRKWWDTIGWAVGMAAFLLFFTWHINQVDAQLAHVEQAASADLGQWLRLGGLDFVLLTIRMNQWLLTAPGWLLWIYLLLALFGFTRQDASAVYSLTLMSLASVAYLLAFAAAGRPENFYWGLIVAPLLPWGVVRAPGTFWALWVAAAVNRRHV